MSARKYRPANGTEGVYFMEKFCDHCKKDEQSGCDILARTMAHRIDDPQYPDEWIYDEENFPICTAFKKEE